MLFTAIDYAAYVDLGSFYPSMPRSAHPSAVIGPLYQEMTEAPVLIVGAGGIGCELGNVSSLPSEICRSRVV